MKKFVLSAKEYYELLKYQEKYKCLESILDISEDGHKIVYYIDDQINKFDCFPAFEEQQPYVNLKVFESETNFLEKVLKVSKKLIVDGIVISLKEAVISDKNLVKFIKSLTPLKVFRVFFNKKLCKCVYFGSSIKESSKYENEIIYDKHYFLIKRNAVHFAYIKDMGKRVLDINMLRPYKIKINELNLTKKDIINLRVLN